AAKLATLLPNRPSCYLKRSERGGESIAMKSMKSKRRAPARNSRKRADSPNVRNQLVREKLIDTAAELFVANGYRQTSINDIAHTLGLRRSSVYHYFQNKEQILEALVEQEA